MPSLRDLLASHGFESNEDYDYIINCLLGYGADRVRCRNVVWDPGAAAPGAGDPGRGGRGSRQTGTAGTRIRSRAVRCLRA